jgi:hypothetical protein
MNAFHSKLSNQLEQSIQAMSKYYDKKRKSIELFTKGEFVMLNAKIIRAKHRCKKLEDKMYGRFEVLATGNNGRYSTLKLPETWKIHLTFNIALLE